MKPLVETDWLLKNIKNVKIIDASWHLPNSGRIAEEEFKKNHIEGSIFFDIEKHSKKNTTLPHMMPDAKNWQRVISSFGINNEDHIIIYDNSSVYSSCRLWFSFIYFGHNTNLVSVLNGGFKKWLKESKKVTSLKTNYKKSDYRVNENKNLIFNRENVDQNIISKKYKLVDARSKERFQGKIPEPRPGLKSGSIPGSENIPYNFCINSDDNTFKSVEDLKTIFGKLNLKENTVFTCGSGITACVLGLANSLINDTNPIIYDESWSGYGLKHDNKK